MPPSSRMLPPSSLLVLLVLSSLLSLLVLSQPTECLSLRVACRCRRTATQTATGYGCQRRVRRRPRPQPPKLERQGRRAQGRDVVVGGVGGLGGVGDGAEVGRRGQPALEGVEHVDPGHDLGLEQRDPDLELAEEAGVGRVPAVELGDVLVGDVVDRHEDLLEGVLDDGGQGAVPPVVLAAEGQPPALEPPGALQRGVRAALAHPGGVEVGAVGGVERHRAAD